MPSRAPKTVAAFKAWYQREHPTPHTLAVESYNRDARKFGLPSLEELRAIRRRNTIIFDRPGGPYAR